METMILILEIVGTIAFAISGAFVAISKKMDIFGVCVLGMTTAVGGGIIRDIIIGRTPPNAFVHPIYVIIAFLISILIFLPFIRKRIDTDSLLFVFFDAIGLGIFTVIGVKAGSVFDNIFLSVFLGTVTGVGGGVLRDIFAAEKPMIFVRHFYATACIIGAIVCTLLFEVNELIAMVSGGVIIIVLRLLAAKFKWHLPKA